MFINEITASRTEILQGGRDVEDAPSSERVAARRCDNDKKTVREGVRVDGEWKHQHVFEGASRCESVRACTCSVRGPHLHSVLTYTWLL